MLKEVLQSSNIKQSELAEHIGITLGTMNLKLNGRADFSVSEAIAIRDYLFERTKKKYKLEFLFERNK